jgi:hypothetical protein
VATGTASRVTNEGDGSVHIPASETVTWGPIFVSVSVHAPCDAPYTPGMGYPGLLFAEPVASQLANTSANAQGSSALMRNRSLPYPRWGAAADVVTEGCGRL